MHLVSNNKYLSLNLSVVTRRSTESSVGEDYRVYILIFMVLRIGNFIWAAILWTNAVAILNEERFLNKSIFIE